MTAEALLTELEALGVRVEISGPDRLRVDAPAHALTVELRETLRAQKASLLRLLKQPAPQFEYRVYERLFLEIGAEVCPLCGGALFCWSAPPNTDSIGYGCRNEPEAHRWTARLAHLFG
jgi:hypothetical protein